MSNKKGNINMVNVKKQQPWSIIFLRSLTKAAFV